MKLKLFLSGCVLLGCVGMAVAQENYFTNWPAGTSPEEIGKQLSEHFVTSPHQYTKTNHYSEVCAWYGALTFAELTHDDALRQELIKKFEPLMPGGAEEARIPKRHHVDDQIFGVVPLEISIQTKDPKYLAFGKSFADEQWNNPTPDGLSDETRFWIDDMYMLTMLQLEAYRATGDKKYLDRDAKEMVAYLDKLQQPNGLFFHAPDVKFYWGRGDGWVAAGMAEMLTTQTGKRIEILAPQRGEKRSLVDLVCQNAKQSYDQRFRVLQPAMKAIQEALQDALTLEELPRRIECFDISHIQGAETVASMVVWEDGAMKKSDYRKFQVKTVSGVDDFASMREVIQRRYKRLQEDKKPFPSLILIDGGLGQLHAAYAALEEIGVTLQPLASIAKREEVIYVYGQEDEPVVLDRRSPVLHLVQKIRDESHRFAVTYHRKRRQMRDRDSELLEIPGVGPRTRQRLIEHFGSIRDIRQAGPDALTAVVNSATAERIRKHFDEVAPGTTHDDTLSASR